MSLVNVSGIVELLRDDALVWDKDFDVVRHQVADLLESMAVALNSATGLIEALTPKEMK